MKLEPTRTPNLMLSPDFQESLPGDPEEAFSLLELHLRSQIPQHKDFDEHYEQQKFDFDRAEFQRQYVITLGAFAAVNDLEIGVDFDNLMHLQEYEFINEFRGAAVKIQLFAQMCAFKLSQRKRAGSTCIYVLSAGAKERIRRSIEEIRTTIEEADLTDLKREALSDKLNCFANEVEKDRTRLESLASMYVQVKKEAGAVTGLSEKVEKLFDFIASGGKELWKALPAVKVTAKLEPPQPKLKGPSEHFDLDDEIPF